LDAAGLVALKLAVTLLVFASGFRAISDDDYARVAIAERFADAAKIDPTGTSWLPFPFYLYGAAFKLLGNSLGVASAVAALLGVLSTLVCWWAARLLGLSRWAAFGGAALCALLPYSAYLGAAAVPEAPSAAICVFAAAALGQVGTPRLLGACALFAACASRYEAWAVAAVFASITARDALQTRDRRMALAAAVAAGFPLLWLLHGIARHGDATFFIARVSAYHAALGSSHSALEHWFATPRGLALGEPELCVVFATLALPLTWITRARDSSRLARFAATLFALFALVMAGEVRGSAPTHHGERALLAIWFGMALLTARAVERLPSLAAKQLRVVAVLGCVSFLLGNRMRREYPRDPFVDRSDAIDIGQRARARRLQKLAIDSDDYAFFAVQAAFGHPAQTLVLDDRDPRRPRSQSWIHDPEQLLSTLRSAQIPALVVPRSRAPFAHAVGSVSEENNGFLLIDRLNR
jgi:hypothetical protein